ncbi:unnamed protein product [Boreogadus saida]
MRRGPGMKSELSQEGSLCTVPQLKRSVLTALGFEKQRMRPRRRAETLPEQRKHGVLLCTTHPSYSPPSLTKTTLVSIQQACACSLVPRRTGEVEVN